MSLWQGRVTIFICDNVYRVIVPAELRRPVQPWWLQLRRRPRQRISSTCNQARDYTTPMPFLVLQSSVCRESAKKKDVRTSNIEAAKAVADSVRTSLGPRGMDKMVNVPLGIDAFTLVISCDTRSMICPAVQVVQPDGEVLITNDGATILQKMTVQHPSAKMLVDLSRSQVRMAACSQQTWSELSSCPSLITAVPAGCGRRGWHNKCDYSMWVSAQQMHEPAGERRPSHTRVRGIPGGLRQGD